MSQIGIVRSRGDRSHVEGYVTIGVGLSRDTISLSTPLKRWGTGCKTARGELSPNIPPTVGYWV